jgi:hypothetical protein
MERGQDAIRAYHRYLGPVADEIARQAPRTSEALRCSLTAFEDLGADEVIVTCWSANLDQFARVADVVS